MKSHLLFLMIAVVASMTFALYANFQNNEAATTSEIEYPNFQKAFAANPYDCSMRISDVENKKTFDYTAPKTLPSGYEVRDAFADKGEVGFFYAPGEICGPNAKYKSFHDGVIEYYTADKTASVEISNPEFYFNEFKNNSDYPDRITIKEIAGHIAIVWDTGMEKNIFIGPDGEILAEKEVSYPAQITIVDEEGERLYLIKGYAPLNDLEMMIKSALPEGQS